MGKDGCRRSASLEAMFLSRFVTQAFGKPSAMHAHQIVQGEVDRKDHEHYSQKGKQDDQYQGGIHVQPLFPASEYVSPETHGVINLLKIGDWL
jgi:hypothetical protein